MASPTWLYAIIVSPEQSQTDGPAPAKRYGSPIWSRAKATALAAAALFGCGALDPLDDGPDDDEPGDEDPEEEEEEDEEDEEPPYDEPLEAEEPPEEELPCCCFCLAACSAARRSAA